MTVAKSFSASAALAASESVTLVALEPGALVEVVVAAAGWDERCALAMI